MHHKLKRLNSQKTVKTSFWSPYKGWHSYTSRNNEYKYAQNEIIVLVVGQV